MKLSLYSVTALLAFSVITLFGSFKPDAVIVTSSVYFGTPPDHASACVGRGVCHNSGGTSSTDGTAVSFQLLPDNPNVLVMSFSLAQLRDVQPDQVTNFTDESHTYNFEANYSLGDPFFAPLNLPANSQILTTSSTQVSINGDLVIVYIVYSHD